MLGAAAVEGIAFKTTRAAVDRAGARSFEHLTGFWPGEKVPDVDRLRGVDGVVNTGRCRRSTVRIALSGRSVPVSPVGVKPRRS